MTRTIHRTRPHGKKRLRMPSYDDEPPRGVSKREYVRNVPKKSRR